MSNYDEFCAHYNLDADTSDSLEQYRQYQAAYQSLMSCVGGAS